MTTKPAKTPPRAPLYQNLVEDLRTQIEGAAEGATKLAVGDRLPSIADLCTRYGVSSITVRAALKELVTGGILESRVGSGFYVRARQQGNTTSPAPRLDGDRVIALQVTVLGANPFFKGIIAGAEAECRRQGYRLLVVISNEDAAQEAQQLRELSQQVAGVLVVPAAIDSGYAGYSALMERRVPFVFVDRAVHGLAAPLVATDNEVGGYIVTRHLLETGLRRICVISERAATSLEERIQGYHRALKEAGVTPDPSWVHEGPLFGDASGYDLTRRLIADGIPETPFGIFALNDNVARGCYAALKEAGLRIPTEVRVVGFDDTDALHMEPPLTTVRQDTEAMGNTAARVLLKMVRAGARPDLARTPRGARLAPELVIRSSSDPASTFSLAEYLSRRSHTLVAVPTSPDLRGVRPRGSAAVHSSASAPAKRRRTKESIP